MGCGCEADSTLQPDHRTANVERHAAHPNDNGNGFDVQND